MFERLKLRLKLAKMEKDKLPQWQKHLPENTCPQPLSPDEMLEQIAAYRQAEQELKEQEKETNERVKRNLLWAILLFK